MTSRDKKKLKRAKELCEEVESLLKKHRSSLTEIVRAEGEQIIGTIKFAISEENAGKAEALSKDLSAWREKNLAPVSRSKTRETIESLAIAIFLALLLRSFVVEPFKIPSGSMLPTLKVGDHIFVSKFLYGLRIPYTYVKFFEWHKPRRGDVIVFRNPQNPKLDFIKRVVGVEGDEVELRENTLFINGLPLLMEDAGDFLYYDAEWKKQKRAHRYVEKIDDTKHSILADTSTMRGNYGPEKVKAGHVFVMGDNRDNSSDSRIIGQVPLDHIKGKALIIWLSFGGGEGIRWDRFFDGID